MPTYDPNYIIICYCHITLDMFHMVCPSVSDTAQQDLECVARNLFKIDDQAGRWGLRSCDSHVIF